MSGWGHSGWGLLRALGAPALRDLFPVSGWGHSGWGLLRALGAPALGDLFPGVLGATVTLLQKHL